MKNQIISDDSFSKDSKGNSLKNKSSDCGGNSLFDNYWRNIPHVPDSEYYSHGE